MTGRGFGPRIEEFACAVDASACGIRAAKRGENRDNPGATSLICLGPLRRSDLFAAVSNSWLASGWLTTRIELVANVLDDLPHRLAIDRVFLDLAATSASGHGPPAHPRPTTEPPRRLNRCDFRHVRSSELAYLTRVHTIADQWAGVPTLNQVVVPDLWQQQAVSALRAGQDVVVHAPTGAGKTLIYE